MRSMWVRSKPPLGVQLKRGHPLAAQLRSAFVMNEGAGRKVWDAARSASGNFPASGVSWGANRDGIAPAFGATAGESIDVTPTALYSISAPFSCEVWWNWRSTDPSKSTWGAPFNCRVAGQPGFQITEESGGTTTYRSHLVIVNAAGTETHHFKGATTFSRPFNNMFLWTWDGTTAKCYVNGVDDSASTSTSSGYATNGVLIGSSLFGSTSPGLIQRVMIWDRVLSAGEAHALYQAPYSMFVPVSHPVPYEVVSGGGGGNPWFTYAQQ